MSSSSLLQRLLDPYRGLSDNISAWSSGTGQMDLKETKQAYIFIFDLPGHGKDDVAVTLQAREGVGTVLQVTAQGREEEEEEEDEVKEKEGANVKWHCRERVRPRGGFSEQLQLPENVEVGGITATMRDGVLTVTVPKLEEEKEKGHRKRSGRRAVEIDGGDGGRRPPPAKGLGRFVCCKA